MPHTKHNHTVGKKVKPGVPYIPKAMTTPMPVAATVMSFSYHKALDGITRYYLGGHPIPWQQWYLGTHAPVLCAYARVGD